MWSNFRSLLTQPIDIANLTPLGWFLFFGLLIMISIAYGMLIRTGSEIAG